jgi:hypothetical protein
MFGAIMFTERHYVPVLRWRQGEFGALSELRQNQKDALTPLIDVPPIAWDFEEDRPSREIDPQHPVETIRRTSSLRLCP